MKDIWKGIPEWIKNSKVKKYILGQKMDSLAIFTMSLTDNIYIDAFIKYDYEVIDERETVETIFNKKIISLENAEEGSIILCPDTYEDNISCHNILNLNKLKICYVPIKKLEDEILEKEIIIYGAANRGKKTAKNLSKYNLKILGFADSDKSKIGYEIIKINGNSLKVIDLDNVKNVVIIISSGYYKEIADSLKFKGFENVFVDYLSISCDIYPYTIIKNSAPSGYDLIWGLRTHFLPLIRDVFDKKIIIYGYNFVGKDIIRVLKLLDKKVEFCIEDTVFETDNREIDVKLKSDILKEDMTDKIILVSNTITENHIECDISEICKLMNMGLKMFHEFVHVRSMENNFSIYRKDENKYYASSFDPLLNYVFDYPNTSEKYSQYIVYGDPETAKKRILILGNSTTDGGMFWPIKCWGEFLFQKYHTNEVVIFNGGMSGYNSRQECLKLLRDIEIINPDVVISFSGVIEICTTYITNHPFTHKRYFKKRIDLNLGIENSEDIKSLWLRMERTMKSISELHGAKYIGILQPTIYNKKVLSRKEKIYYVYGRDEYNEDFSYSAYKNQYEELIKVAKSKEFIEDDSLYDFTEIFMDNPNNIFRDNCHAYESGNQIIADEIYKIITNKNLL